MATHLSVLNRVLARLRESQVNSVADTDYSKLVGDFVREAYQEVSEEMEWRTLRHEIILDLVATQASYDISATVAGGGDVRTAGNTRVCKSNSRLDWLEDEPQVYMYDDASDTSGFPLIYVTRQVMQRLKINDRTDTDANPPYVCIYPNEANTKLFAEFYPIPSATREVFMYLFTDPDELTTTGSTDNTVLLVPHTPVFRRSLQFAYHERGEELGEPGNQAETMYFAALSKAKEADLEHAERADKHDWRRD